MGLIPTDIQTKSRKKLFSIFRFFSLFSFPTRRSSDLAEKDKER